MAEARRLKQFKGPFAVGQAVNLGKGNCKIGISIGEKDFMRISQQNSSFQFEINGQLFFMGRTCMYQTDQKIDDATIVFPNGAPLSTIVDIVYID